MNRFWIYVLTLVLLASCEGNRQKETKASAVDTVKNTFKVNEKTQQVDTLVLTKTDSAFVIKNKAIKDDMGDKQASYIIQIYFNNKQWPALTFKNAIGVELALVGDLDGDQQPELLLKPDWFSSCWSTVNLFSLKNNTWKMIKSGSMYFCSDQYPLNKRVVKTTTGYGLLTDSLTDDKFITLKKTINF